MSLSDLHIDPARCGRCGLCVPACPAGALSQQDGAVPQVSDACTLCGICVDSCPDGAISIERGPAVVIDKTAWRDMWVVAELLDGSILPVTYELLGAARALAARRRCRVAAVIMGADIASQVSSLVAAGADIVYLADDKAFVPFRTEQHAAALLDLITRYKPETVLYAATCHGRDLAGIVATSLETGLTADCTGLDIADDGGLLMTRPAFGGNIMATIVCPGTRPQMSTVRPRTFPVPEPAAGRSGDVITFGPADVPSGISTELLEFLPSVHASGLDDAEIIVAGGRGMQKPGNFTMLKECADVLGGSVGASRAAVDAGWAPYEQQIGQTGRTVRPRIYIACGISGSVQHLAGMKDSDEIIAINRDPGAPIFRYARLGLVGDAMQLLPRIVDELKRRGFPKKSTTQGE